MNPSPNKILRVVLRNHVANLVPADAAIALVLRHDYKTTPSIEELVKLSRVQASRCLTGAVVNVHARKSLGGRGGGGRVFRLGVGVVAHEEWSEWYSLAYVRVNILAS